jgi:hypothetical protein
LAAGCATASDIAPAARVAGCWINRDAGTITMRWMPDAARQGVLNGAKTSYGVSGVTGAERFTLEPHNAGWSFCQRTGDGQHCWDVAQGEGGSLEGGRAFIDTAGDNLRIAIMGDGPERVVFQGRRYGCD